MPHFKQVVDWRCRMVLTRKREEFSGEFDKYESNTEVTVLLKNIKNSQGVLVKKQLVISQHLAFIYDLFGNLMPGQLVYFSAVIEVDSKYDDGFDLVDIVIHSKERGQHAK